MLDDFDVLGVFFPALLVLMLISYGIHLIVRTVFSRLGLYRFVWHRSIFDLGVYIITLGALVLISR